jgi:hypothetical protein
MNTETAQLGFDALLSAADQENNARELEKQFGHLPGTMEQAIPYFRALIHRHHEAMIEGDGERVRALRDEAHDLAVKLNNYESGIIADEDSPGCVLEHMTAAPNGTVPLWGQSGNFEIQHDGMRVMIEMDGVFGIGATAMSWIGFAAHAVEWDRPFLSETGYRSFLGVGGALSPGYAPEAFAKEIIAAHVKREMKGKLVSVAPRHRP